jgi:hypothetical protein
MLDWQTGEFSASTMIGSLLSPGSRRIRHPPAPIEQEKHAIFRMRAWHILPLED